MNIRNLSQLFIFAAVLTTLCSCAGGSPAFVYSEGDTIRFSYSQLITMVRYDGFTKVEMTNPWDTSRLLATYILTPKPENYTSLADPAHGVSVVKTPLHNSLVFSSVHCALLAEMGKAEAISGVCDIQYIHTLSHPVTDCGSSMSPNMERIIQLHPSAMLVSPYENRTGYDRLQQVGIPIIECAEYMEKSALARAEWVKFYGELYGAEKESKAIFEEVERNYKQFSALAQKTKERPVIVSETLYGNVWYQPGACSSIGCIYQDAGARIAFPEYKQSGSVALSAEQVFARAHDADVWLMSCNETAHPTLAALKSEAEVYARFKAFKTGNVWAYDTNTSRFFERSTFHPDGLLSDIIKICHPNLLTDKPMNYYHQLR